MPFFFFLIMGLICAPLSSFFLYCGIALALGVVKSPCGSWKGNRGFVLEEGEIRRWSLGVAVTCVSCSINTVSTWYVIMSPRKVVRIITTD